MKGFAVLLNHSSLSDNCCLRPVLCPHATSWVEVSRSALLHNIRQYKKIVGDALLAPVVKSNAYGHGIDLIAPVLDQCSDVAMLCVVSLSEAIRLRHSGILKPILVLSIIDADPADAIQLDIAVVVYDVEFLQALNKAAQLLNKRARVHVKVDTGLSRLGLLVQDLHAFINVAQTMSNINLEGIFSHLANSERSEHSFSHTQIQVFNSALEALKHQSICFALTHISCSAAITVLEKSHFNMVRLGIGVYGLWPSHENAQATKCLYPDFNLRPVLTWKTRPIQIKNVPAGTRIGYDCTHVTHRPTTLATLPVGYWDGYDRGFSNSGHVLINGLQAPILGRIAMNLCMVDVTDISSVTRETEVILIGEQNGVQADQLAQKINTINYELVTRINPLIKRSLVE